MSFLKLLQKVWHLRDLVAWLQHNELMGGVPHHLNPVNSEGHRTTQETVNTQDTLHCRALVS